LEGIPARKREGLSTATHSDVERRYEEFRSWSRKEKRQVGTRKAEVKESGLPFGHDTTSRRIGDQVPSRIGKKKEKTAPFGGNDEGVLTMAKNKGVREGEIGPVMKVIGKWKNLYEEKKGESTVAWGTGLSSLGGTVRMRTKKKKGLLKGRNLEKKSRYQNLVQTSEKRTSYPSSEKKKSRKRLEQVKTT